MERGEPLEHASEIAVEFPPLEIRQVARLEQPAQDRRAEERGSRPQDANGRAVVPAGIPRGRLRVEVGRGKRHGQNVEVRRPRATVLLSVVVQEALERRERDVRRRRLLRVEARLAREGLSVRRAAIGDPAPSRSPHCTPPSLEAPPREAEKTDEAGRFDDESL